MMQRGYYQVRQGQDLQGFGVAPRSGMDYTYGPDTVEYEGWQRYAPTALRGDGLRAFVTGRLYR